MFAVFYELGTKQEEQKEETLYTSVHGGREEIVHSIRSIGRSKSRSSRYYQAVNDWLKEKKIPVFSSLRNPGFGGTNMDSREAKT